MGKAKRVTAADVAREAGVSRATVSYTLNDVKRQRISEETRDRIREVADRLGYTPNPSAVSLRTGSNKIVLVAIPYWPLGPAVTAFISDVVSGLEDFGYHPLVMFRGTVSVDQFESTWSALHPVGVLAPSALLEPQTVRRIRAGGTQAIIGIGNVAAPSVSTLIVEQGPVGSMVAEHLVAQGHRHLALVYPDISDAEPIVAGRVPAIREVLEPVNGTIRRLAISGDLESVREQVAGALASDPKPTAFIGYSDGAAVRALNALRSLDVRVPEDVALTGVDDSEAARLANPPLTSVRLPDHESAAIAVDALHALIKGEPIPLELGRIPSKLIVRESTNPALSPV